MAEKYITNLVQGAVEAQATYNRDHGSNSRSADSIGSICGETTPQKRSWPELEGLTAEEAEKKIKEEMPMADVQIIAQGHPVTKDYRTNRVRIFVDSSNKVVGTPSVG